MGFQLHRCQIAHLISLFSFPSCKLLSRMALPQDEGLIPPSSRTLHMSSTTSDVRAVRSVSQMQTLLEVVTSKFHLLDLSSPVVTNTNSSQTAFPVTELKLLILRTILWTATSLHACSLYHTCWSRLVSTFFSQ